MLAKKIQYFYKQKYGYLISNRGIKENITVITNNDFYSNVEIKVPWGLIKAKLWGSIEKQPVLAIHGWMENAGSFDKLAPLIKRIPILAIDLPGHGLSSWIPPGMVYDENIFSQTIRLIQKYFGWEKIKLLGHSMGGIFCYNYARLFPDSMHYVISIDSLSIPPTDINKHSTKQALAIDEFINYENNILKDPPSYPEDIAIKKWISANSFNSLDVNAVKILMNRGAKKKADGTYFYTRDYRLSIEGFYPCYTADDVKNITKLITCPYLALKASQSIFEHEYWLNAASNLKQTSVDFRLVEIEGLHHIHLVNAEVVANAINLFLEKYETNS